MQASQRVLVISFYYSPDLQPCAFRVEGLVEALVCELEQRGSNAEIDVITTMPTRFDSGVAMPEFYTKQGRVNIYRLPLANKKNGFINEARLFIGFAYQVLSIAKKQKYNLIFSTSARLMSGFIAAWIARRQKATLYVDIRDNFVENLNGLFVKPWAVFFGRVFSYIEHFVIRQARVVNLNSPGFSDYFLRRYPKKKFRYFTNGLDLEFLHYLSLANTKKNRPSSQKLQVLYAGNLGKAQDLHSILPELAKRLERKIEIIVIGAGRSREMLEQKLCLLGIDNVSILEPMSRQKLAEYYVRCDVLFLHLADVESFKQVLPSKLFEYAATNKPVWAGVDGYAKKFIQAEIEGAVVFKPSDLEAAVSSFYKLKFQALDRSSFVQKYARVNISSAMAKDILDSPLVDNI